MKLLLLDCLDERELLYEIDRIGADRRSFPYFAAKDETLLLAAKDLDVRAANALKQEMLSRGGDIIVNKRTIDCGVTHTDALLMGTPGSFRACWKNSLPCPIWARRIKIALGAALRNARRRSWDISLPGDEHFPSGIRPASWVS